MKKILIILFCLVSFNALALEKTTFDKAIFDKSQSDGKVVMLVLG